MTPPDDAGAGLLSTSTGVMVFLVLLLFAVQVAFDLYATSVITSAAWDGARIVAGADAGATADRGQARAEADAHIRRLLGGYGDRVKLEWSDHGGDVVLTVSARHPGFLPVALRRPLGLDETRRTVRIRSEQVVGWTGEGGT